MKEQSDAAAKAAKAALDEQQRSLRADAAAAHGDARKFKRQAAATGEAGAAAVATLEAAHASDLSHAASRSKALLVEQVRTRERESKIMEERENWEGVFRANARVCTKERERERF